MAIKLSRRRAMLYGGGALAVGAGIAALPQDHGVGGHSDYFAGISSALQRAGIAQPTLVIDRARLLANIDTVHQTLVKTHLGLRIVTKSLQAPALLRTVMERSRSESLMVFNGVMLEDILAFHGAADILLGRPLPAVQAKEFVQRHHGDARAAAHPQWLVDTPQRLAEYGAIAQAQNYPMRINLEIDVGLHRGGLPDAQALQDILALSKAHPLLQICGLMGYDAHVVGVPFPEHELNAVKKRYAAATGVLSDFLRGDTRRLTLNTAGSPTYHLHLDDSNVNEVALGSGFVQPLNFDMPSLSQHVPAVFIAEPVLKASDQALIPTIESLAPLLNWIDPNSRQGFFVYGGYGDAEPVSPLGLEFSPLYGDRAMLTGSQRVNLKTDDFVFFRPRESEGTFLQFGDIAVYDQGEIADRWPTFRVAA